MKSATTVTTAILGAAVFLTSSGTSVTAQGVDYDSFSWRSIGPAVFSGRVVDIAVKPGDPSTIWVASGSGGLWKTTNRGTKWKPVFDDLPVISIGDVAVAPSDSDVLWIGSGEANNQRSSYWGDGVYKSTDGGDSWTHMGLPESHHIGRIVIHPSNPDIVYVAALGHLYSANPERGLYRTRDGGKTWKLVKFIDADTGFVDVVLDPTNPDTVFAASYQRRRRAWHFSESGPGSAVWRSTNGGDSWKRVRGGLPKGEIGRIGLCMFGDGKTLYATVENRNPKGVERPRADATGGNGAGRDERTDETEEEDIGGHRWGDGAEGDAAPGAAPAAPVIGNEIYRSDDGGESWRRVNERTVGGSPPYYYGQIRTNPRDKEDVWVLGVPVYHSTNGGKTWGRNGARGVHVDHHALWIDPEDPDHMLLGNDGGLCQTYDGGKTWDIFNNLPLAQFYAVALDNRKPYRVYGGTQDNGSWGIPSIGKASRGIYESDVYRVNGGDGFYCAVDPEDPDVVYSESQFGRPSRLDLRTMERKSIRPPRKRGEPGARYNWMTPIVISPHNPRTIYIASQRLHRSYDRGDSWEAISPDLTTDDPEKKKGNVPHCTITTVSESPVRKGVIWVGTDDGNVWVTQDAGRHWRDVTDMFPDSTQALWVSRVEASHHDKGKCYVSFTGYREDRFKPELFVTDDFGGTWTSLSEGLPQSSVNVVREDSKNEDLLFVGNEHGVQVSLDAGDTWAPLSKGMPTNPVHDLAIHQRDSDIVAATHGRGFFVLDVAPLRELTAKNRAKDVHLCGARVITLRSGMTGAGDGGARVWRAPNPRSGAHLAFWLANAPENADDVKLEIRDAAGTRIRTVRITAKQGLNRARWDLRQVTRRGNQRGAAGGRGRGGRSSRGRGRGTQGRSVPSGTYAAVLKVGEEEYAVAFHVQTPPPRPALEGMGEDEDQRLKGRDF